MNCKKCGMLLTVEDKFCRNCGALVNEMNAQPNLNNNMNINGGMQNMPYQAVMDNKPKKHGFLIVTVIIVAIIIIALAVIFVPKLIDGSIFNGNSNSGKVDTGESVNNGQNTTPSVTSSYKVNFGGFTFKIPDNMIYETTSDVLSFGDEDSTWRVQLMVANVGFNQYKNNISRLQSYFQQQDFTAQPAEVKTIGGIEYVTIELVTSNGTNFIGAYAKLNSMKTAWMAAYNQDNEYDYNILEKIVPVISSATYNDMVESITSPEFNFNIDEISALGQ